MRLDDLSVVMDLEVRCFDSPWTVDTYRRELTRNPRAVYRVVRPAAPADRPDLPSLLAYGGCWVMGDECHLMTIATHPEWRGRLLGEWLLLDLLAEARQRAAELCTLEVRAGNAAAIRLYEKLGFQQVGRRPGYYPTTAHAPREDALIMTLFGLDEGAVWRHLIQRRRTVENAIERGFNGLRPAPRPSPARRRGSRRR
jgi:ribosomal-protein-alanine N-acetyltransferase